MLGARTFTFLGTGTSVGVPMVGCDCDVCRSTNPRNHRYRCSVLIGTPQGNILIDTPPELRLQLLRAKVGIVHATLFTHFHADHVFGLEGLRVLVLDALRWNPHPGHFNIEQSLEVIDRVKPARAYLTHMSHEVEHESANRQLPPGVELAYDGLKFEF